MNCEKQQIDINLISHTATFLSFILWQICYVLISEMVDKSCKIWPIAFIHNCFLALFSLHLAHFKVKSCSWFNEVLQTQMTLQWRHNGHNSISNHQPHDCLLNYIFTHWSKKTSKLRVTDLCAGNSPVTAEFPTQRASNTESVSIWSRHHGCHTLVSHKSYDCRKYRCKKWSDVTWSIHYCNAAYCNTIFCIKTYK